MRRVEGFTAYVERRRAHLFRAAYLLCGDAHRAEDLVQTTLTKLYVHFPRVAGAANADAYARRVLVNSHVDETRRPWRRERSYAELPDRAADSGLAPEEADELWAALRALPAGQRRVVVLRHYWGLSVEETAGDLGISTGTVKSQTSLALAALARALRTDVTRGER